MKNLPKINPAKAVKASLPYVFAGLLCTKLGEAYRPVSYTHLTLPTIRLV